MKIKFTILSFIMLCAVCAQAQFTRFASEQLISGGTNNVTLLASNSYTTAMADVSNQSDVGIQVHGVPISSNMMNLRLDFMRSVDGSVWVSTNFVSIVAQGGTNDLSAGVVCVTTNVNVSGIRSLKLFRVANLDYHGIVTNLTVTYGIKK